MLYVKTIVEGVLANPDSTSPTPSNMEPIVAINLGLFLPCIIPEKNIDTAKTTVATV
jgi:hypothetical protein